MPTGCKLISAVYFAIFAYLLAGLIQASIFAATGYPAKTGLMRPMLVLLGIILGWRVMGVRGGQGRNYAIQGGILTAVSVIFWGIVVISLRTMVKNSTKGKYPDTPAAVMGGFDLAIGYVKDYWTVSIVLLILLGGALGGIVADWAARRWR